MASRTGSQQTKDTTKHGGGPTRGSRTSQAQTAASRRTNQTRGLTRGNQTRGGETRGGQTTAGGSKKPTSLFDDNNNNGDPAQPGDTNEGVKANDIWSKFVNDDANVVRAPTADSKLSGGSEYQLTGSQGSQRPSQIDEDDEDNDEEEEEESSDDDRTIYSDYYMAPGYTERIGTPEIRAEIVDSHEACSCFPDRSNKLIGSMLYDKIQCVHTGLTGHTQPGVYKFTPFWHEGMEAPKRLRKRDMNVSKTKFVFGYPRPRFEIVSDSEEEEEEDEHSQDEDDGEISQTGPMTGQRSRYSDDDEDDDEDDERDDDFIPFELPQIGYAYTPSPPPSSHSYRSEYSSYSNVPDSLPELPKTRQLTAQTAHSKRTQKTQQTRFSNKTAKTGKTGKTGVSVKDKKSAKDDASDGVSGRTGESRQSLPDGPIVGASRTFQGKVYDPVTKQVLLYDIGTKAGERLPVGNIEPLYKPPTPQVKGKGKDPGPGDKTGSRASNRSKGSQGSGPNLKAAVVGAAFISNLLSKNKQKRNDFELEDG